MSESNFPALYLGVLLILLATVGWFVFRQIIRTRRIELSLARLQNKLKQERGTAQEYFELGSIYLNKKLTSQAIPMLQKALKAAETDSTAVTAPIFNALGFAYFSQDQYDLAIRNYREALEQNPTYVTAANNLGHAYERKNLTSQALEAYEQVLKTEPNNPTAKKRANSLRKRMPAS